VKRFIVILPAVLCLGCVERTLRVRVDQPGARVLINGEERGYTTEIRRNVDVPFLWYGNYEILIRKEGYLTEKVTYTTRAPLYEWIGPDFFAEILPIQLHDIHEVPLISLRAREGPPSDDEERKLRRDNLVDRAEQLQQRVIK